MLEENARIERLNELIDARNKEIAKENENIKKENKRIIEKDISSRLLRSFQIDGFGIWNCDRVGAPKTFPINAIFKDEKGNSLNLTNIAVIGRSLNGIFLFSDNRIGFIKDDKNMILGVCNGRFAYISYKDCDALNINSDTKEQIFIMTVVSEKNNNYEFIKKVLEE